ncbi:MAG: FAD-dependent oxidoreductase [Puia sp.]|nr:FAD-dependent oxidoreductase [Puia sp.]
MPGTVTIIGGGVIGLCCAYYLQKEGFEVTIIDQGDITRGTSFGNAGYVSPSHFIPLASPHIIAKALVWMLDSSSPFYIQPRFDRDLIRWCMAFWRSAARRNMERNIPPLHAILQLSRELMNTLRDDLGNHFRMAENGCFMLYKTEASGKKERQLAGEAKALGIRAKICDAGEISALEPNLEVDVLGGVLYPIDCHLHPGDFMETLKTRLDAKGVRFRLNTRVIGFRMEQNRVLSVITDQGEFEGEQWVLAAGSWLPEIARMIGIRLLLQPGKGYSITYPEIGANLCHPAILVERRVAVTPMGRDLRLGGTMELTGINDRVLPNRVDAIYEAAKAYFPGLEIDPPEMTRVWKGLRPLSPDGLPYIGRHPAFANVAFAGGHSMLGLSLAAATGKLVKEIIAGEKSSIDLSSFNINRFRVK